MIGALIFLCVPVEATSATAFLCASGEKVILADVRAAAGDEATRQQQRQSLAAIALNKRLICRSVDTRGTAVIGRCTYEGRDIALQQVSTGNAQFKPLQMMASAR